MTNMLLNALVAGLIVPLVAHSMTLLALIALCLTLGAWGFWVWQDRVGSGTLAVPGDPETLEPTDRM